MLASLYMSYSRSSFSFKPAPSESKGSEAAWPDKLLYKTAFTHGLATSSLHMSWNDTMRVNIIANKWSDAC